MELARYRFPDVDLQTIEAVVRDQGICILEGFLASDQVRQISAELKRLHDEHAAWLRHHQTASGYFMSCSPLRLKQEAARAPALVGALRTPLIPAMSARYLGPGWYLETVIADFKNPSGNPITNWHSDDPASLRGMCLKFMFYLCDISSDNGAFAFVPKSHRLIGRLAQAVGRHGETQEALYDYFDMRQTALKVGSFDDILKSTEFNAMDEAIVNAGNDAFSVEAPAGSVIVFDSCGVHRGGVPEHGSRSIFRAHFRNFQASAHLSTPRNAYNYARNVLARRLA